MTLDFSAALREKVWLYDGSKGFLLIQRGLAPGEFPDLWNTERGREVYDIHRAYVDAGADIIQTNTLGASRYHLEAHGLYARLSDINRAGAALAREAVSGNASRGTARALVAASVGPLGRLLEPFGELPFEDAVDVFKEQIAVLLDAGVDILHFETFTDLAELRAAVIAARELGPGTPVIATVSPESGGSTVMGDDAGCAVAVLDALGAACVGMNCGLAPRAMLSVFGRLSDCGAALCAKPNAGSPELDGGELRYGATEEEFYETAFGFAGLGARLVGGCCGSGPAHIRRLRAAVDTINASPDYAWDRLRGGRATRSAAAGGILLASARARVTVAAPELAAGCKEFLAAGVGRPVEIGQCLFVDLSEFVGKSADMVDVLCDADESDAAVSVFCLPGDDTDERARSERAAILTAIAENARSYHTKPLAFCSADTAALALALRRYCGVSAALVPARAADAARVDAALYGSPVIRL